MVVKGTCGRGPCSTHLLLSHEVLQMQSGLVPVNGNESSDVSHQTVVTGDDTPMAEPGEDSGKQSQHIRDG